MKTRFWTARCAVAFLILWPVLATAAEKEVPVPEAAKTVSGAAGPGATIQLQTPGGIVSVRLPLSSYENAELPVAEVNGDPIPLYELNGELMTPQAEDGQPQPAGHEDLHAILKRIIDLRLLEQEARNIGFDETADFVKEEGAFKSQLLRKILVKQQIGEVQPDEEEVAQLTKEMSTFVKLESVLFAKEEDAAKALAEINGGAAFRDVAKKVIQNKTAEGSLLGASSYSFDQLTPQVLEFVKKAKSGEMSPVLSMGDTKYALVRVEEEAKTKDAPEFKEQARQKLLTKKNLELLKTYFEGLKQKYAVIHQEIIDSLDYAAVSPGLETLLKDDRVIIEIKDEAPITVAEFSKELDSKLYHGSEAKENRARLNGMKKLMEDNLLYKKIFIKEAMLLGLDQTKEFQKGVESFERKALFSAFVNKVIVPEAQVKEEAVRKYYDDHQDDYSTPKMLRIKALVFDSLDSAKGALALLRQNTDFQWLSTNAEHQVGKDSEGLLVFDGTVLSLSQLPPAVQEVISDAKDGDCRLYQDPGAGRFYVLSIEKVFPAKPTPYEEVRKAIATELFNKRVPELIEEWAAKLQKAYEVKIFLVAGHE